MSFNPSRIARAVSAAVLGATLFATTAPVFSQAPGEGGRGPAPRAQMSEADRAQMRERMQARMSQRLDRLAARLEIKASQQDAWASYRKTVESLMQDRPQRRAKSLFVMADATGNLQQVLDPAQRKVLDEITRNFGRHGRRGGHPGGDHQGPRGGGERNRV